MRKNLSIILLLALCSFSSYASFPENSLSIPVSYTKTAFGLKKAQFDKVSANFLAIMSEYFTQIYQKKLILKTDWENAKVDARATRDEFDNPIIHLFGGLARHELMTEDALMLILCHEAGHYAGGAPKRFRGQSTKRSWSSAEGQADYYASSKCLKRVFLKKFSENLNLTPFSLNEIEKVKDLCEQSLMNSTSLQQVKICQRILFAGITTGKIFHSIKSFYSKPEIDNSDDTVVTLTEFKHPSPQCRLDTFVAGAICEISFNDEFDISDPKIGACLHEKGLYRGHRPFCWYYPGSL